MTACADWTAQCESARFEAPKLRWRLVTAGVRTQRAVCYQNSLRNFPVNARRGGGRHLIGLRPDYDRIPRHGAQFAAL